MLHLYGGSIYILYKFAFTCSFTWWDISYPISTKTPISALRPYGSLEYDMGMIWKVAYDIFFIIRIYFKWMQYISTLFGRHCHRRAGWADNAPRDVTPIPYHLGSYQSPVENALTSHISLAGGGIRVWSLHALWYDHLNVVSITNAKWLISLIGIQVFTVHST